MLMPINIVVYAAAVPAVVPADVPYNATHCHQNADPANTSQYNCPKKGLSML